MKVLISDDDPTLRLLMSTLLRKKLGYEVFETTNGLNAWQALDSGMAVDLCILDMWMPEMGGVDLLSKLRSDPRFKRQKVILCSSEDGKELILKVAALGVSGYLIKPFVTQHFLDQVRKACEGGQPAPGHGALEEIEAVLERLGIGREAYLQLLNVFAKDVAGLIGELQAASATEGKRDMETRLSPTFSTGGGMTA
jgi:CheY-like chemotaxis protein